MNQNPNKSMSSPTDLVATQDEYRKHVWPICLWPKQWSTCRLTLQWNNVALDHEWRSEVPDTKGIYSLVVEPEIAGNLSCSYLMYVGRATNLRKRFGDYLTRERTERPKVVRLLEMYTGHIFFYYSTDDNKDLKTTEEQLINAFVPPCNSRFTGVVQGAQGAFS